MSEVRTNKVVLIIGGRGSGKTTLGQNLFVGIKKPSMYGLVVDTFDHPDYRTGFVRITPEMLPRIADNGIYRMFGGDTGRIEAAIEKHARNAVVMFEDASKYMNGAVNENQRKFILDSKQKNLDLIYMFHGFGFVPPTLYRLVDAIYLLRTNDSPDTRKSLIPCYAEVRAMYERIRASADKYPREAILLN